MHGDLHPGNVLRGGPGRGVVAIDPRPCLGDPAFDAVDWVLAGGGGEAAVQNRIDRLAGYLDEVDADRVWGMVSRAGGGCRRQPAEPPC